MDQSSFPVGENASQKLKEKKKWQIAFRRYVVESQPSVFYAPYFGLDVPHIRNWFECQFSEGIDWSNFGKRWQFEHIVPVSYFDFSLEADLHLCWNFTNLRVGVLEESPKRNDLLHARAYYSEIFQSTGLGICRDMLEKIAYFESEGRIETTVQAKFLKEQGDYLNKIEGFDQEGFELLNQGRNAEEAIKELNFFKKIANPPQSN